MRTVTGQTYLTVLAAAAEASRSIDRLRRSMSMKT